MLRSRLPNCASVDPEIHNIEIIECETPRRHNSTIKKHKLASKRQYASPSIATTKDNRYQTSSMLEGMFMPEIGRRMQ